MHIRPGPRKCKFYAAMQHWAGTVQTRARVPSKHAKIFQECSILDRIKSQLSASLRGLFQRIFQELMEADLCNALLNILGIFCTFAWAFRPGSNVQNIPGIFQEYSRNIPENYFINQLLLIGRIFNGIFLCMQLFVTFLFLMPKTLLL